MSNVANNLTPAFDFVILLNINDIFYRFN